MATVRTVTLPDGSTFTMSDWGAYPLHSRAYIATANAQDVVIFNYVESGVVPGGAQAAPATLLDTNIPTAGQLPLRHQMVIFGIGIRFDEADADQSGLTVQASTVANGILKWQEISNNVWFQFLVEATKPYSEGYVTEYPTGGGLYFYSTEDFVDSPAKDQAYYCNNGHPGAHAARRLAMPIHLGALEQFKGVFKFPRGAINFSDTATPNQCDYGLTVILHGPRQRPLG